MTTICVQHSDDGRPKTSNLAEKLYRPNPFIASLDSKLKLWRRSMNEIHRRELLL
jgi:hypothetical protein